MCTNVIAPSAAPPWSSFMTCVAMQQFCINTAHTAVAQSLFAFSLIHRIEENILYYHHYGLIRIDFVWVLCIKSERSIWFYIHRAQYTSTIIMMRWGEGGGEREKKCNMVLQNIHLLAHDLKMVDNTAGSNEWSDAFHICKELEERERERERTRAEKNVIEWMGGI